MLYIDPNRYKTDELVYIPVGAEKGDCPYCYTGVLRREEEVQQAYRCKEGYICSKCGTVFLETIARYYARVAVWSHNFFCKKRN